MPDNETTSTDMKHLLADITKIRGKYDEIARISGENFNVFEVLGLKSSENIHSKFIAMLLNPKGIHEKGGIFLKLFLQQNQELLQISDLDNFDNASVVLEKDIGLISKDKTNGGRIDIVIYDKSGKERIFIENKIYAGDQTNQLQRYHNHNQDAIIVYLTLDGHDASNSSTNGVNFKYLRLSYAENILNWLEQCKKEAVDNAFLLNTIKQYILLIKSLTGQAKDNEMKAEIYKTLSSSKENVDSYFLLKNTNEYEFLKYIVREKFAVVLDDFCKKKDIEVEYINHDGYSPDFADCLLAYWGFEFAAKCGGNAEKRWGDLRISFVFHAQHMRYLKYGFYHRNGNWIDACKNMEFKDDFNPVFQNWISNKDVLSDICSGSVELIKCIEEKIDSVISNISQENP